MSTYFQRINKIVTITALSIMGLYNQSCSCSLGCSTESEEKKLEQRIKEEREKYENAIKKTKEEIEDLDEKVKKGKEVRYTPDDAYFEIGNDFFIYVKLAPADKDTFQPGRKCEDTCEIEENRKAIEIVYGKKGEYGTKILDSNADGNKEKETFVTYNEEKTDLDANAIKKEKPKIEKESKTIIWYKGISDSEYIKGECDRFHSKYKINSIWCKEKTKAASGGPAKKYKGL